MDLVEKIFQAIKILPVLADLWLQSAIYKYCKKDKIKRNEEDINGKCVVITGGSSGIGKSSAKEFARRGAVVVIGDVDMLNGGRVVQEIKKDTGNMNVVNLRMKRFFLSYQTK